MAWAMVPEEAVSVTGEPKVYNSSLDGRRSFCGSCGTGLFFSNAPLQQMGMMQVRVAVLDDPEAIAPQMQVQTAERVKWVTSLHELPAFERFPG
ncbi:GFA family protein [Methylobacterium sp. E-005]|nr:GFA family protein [Methylobacterium sp. E-005]